ncbi:MAG: DegT/DnrJ/EryC1/StrS aminotransferase family protein [Candidatus Gottesmanbacteria bacterium GW2011_GWC1_43_10]|nr:MAG: DegT/DnrJ/EryC1/StrS aminotransferase family protein [Candidatus Gottesmanbacteria bacterium GW2011_GWA2_42_16]KKS80129.1 MAG: DegT/DnrJ/EryC1/StrS aminotransferase family protein [Candidatus Gottesmanbacteria bacterium GW2011_GWC1_43_10]OGG10430.1 MAG: hypothetical protein A2699_05185 [Candidatus Gottesmanbacteria bacterium RIFCSPHIGHO2_01_FULL_43_15]OGG28051.1 MAG: hypothetical protein A3A59_02405 [Candidatus Gottesmanbacteria bacterium RIFCSPLOWO2_01_FULL_42_10]
MYNIPLCEPWFEPSYAEKVRGQILSGQIGPGPVTMEFARRLAAFAKAKYCVLTTSGTVALSLAALALGLKPGDEILVPAYGVVSTINALAFLGLKPRLVDIDQTTGCMSPHELEKRITPQTRGVCFVNFSGYTGQNLVQVAQICRARHLPLIEDAACALGHKFWGKSAGTFGTIGIYSFSVPKIITCGQGGALITNSATLFRKLSQLIDQGDLNWRRTNLIHGIGSNFRFNDILAAFGLVQLGAIDKRITRKKAVFAVFKKMLKRKIFQVPGAVPPLHQIVFTPKPHSLVKYLKRCGISGVRQYRTLSEHPPYANLSDRKFPAADFWTRYAVYLPFGLALETQDAQKIVKALLTSGCKLLDIENL